MPHTTTTIQADQPSERGSLILRLLVFPSIVSGVVLGNQAFSSTWVCAIIPATAIACLASAFAAATLPTLRHNSRRSQRWHLASALLLGVLAGSLYPAWKSMEFSQCFGAPPPPGVRDLRVIAKHFEGATEHTLIMEFNAEPTVVTDLLKRGGFADTGGYITEWQQGGGTWQALENALLGYRPLGFSQRTFRRLKPMIDFEVYEAEPSELVWYVMIWERATNRVLLFNILG